MEVYQHSTMASAIRGIYDGVNFSFEDLKKHGDYSASELLIN